MSKNGCAPAGEYKNAQSHGVEEQNCNPGCNTAAVDPGFGKIYADSHTHDPGTGCRLDWGLWSSCTACSPSGTRTRVQEFGNDCKAKITQTQACNSCGIKGATDRPPVTADLEERRWAYTCWHAWSAFDSCKGHCLTHSNMERWRTKKGQCSGAQRDRLAWCTTCQDHCWRGWSAWTACPKCLKDVWRMRFRTSTNECKTYKDKDRVPCIDCGAECYKQWGAWGGCDTGTVACGNGKRYRTRNAWNGCREPEQDAQHCKCTDKCWNAWSAYVGHEGACGVGTKHRARGSRNKCKGEVAQTQQAFWDPGCALDGPGSCWGAWAKWSECPVACGGVRNDDSPVEHPGGGLQVRVRASHNECADTVLAYGPDAKCTAGTNTGKPCASDADCPGGGAGACDDFFRGKREAQPCNTHACDTVPPSASPTGSPSMSPSVSPSDRTAEPTTSPSVSPSGSPTISPSRSPSESPTLVPSDSPSVNPTKLPSMSPSAEPSTSPSKSSSPTTSPTDSPSTSPTGSPSASPSASPTESPTNSPSKIPSASPTTSPTTSPTAELFIPFHVRVKLRGASAGRLASSTNRDGASALLRRAIASAMDGVTDADVAIVHICAPQCGSQWPSVSPTTSPTQSPSTSPSLSPSASPSVPTAAPSESPSASPSTPSVAPSTSPYPSSSAGRGLGDSDGESADVLVVVTANAVAVIDAGGGRLAPGASPLALARHLVTQLRNRLQGALDAASFTNPLLDVGGIAVADLIVDAAPASPSPSTSPTHVPSASPTPIPSASPSESPTPAPSASPSMSPTFSPTEEYVTTWKYLAGVTLMAALLPCVFVAAKVFWWDVRRKAQNKAFAAATAGLPSGWISKDSVSRPGFKSFQNLYTKETIQWKPIHPARKRRGESVDLNPEAGLPPGWTVVPSTSRPGELSYVNTLNGAKVAWRPHLPAAHPNALTKPHQKHVVESQALPAGWSLVASQTRKGEISYENDHTGERIQWRPRDAASKKYGKSPDLNPSRGLPEGWSAVPSTSRPGELSYVNSVNGAKVGWRPTLPAADPNCMTPPVGPGRQDTAGKDGKDGKKRRKKGKKKHGTKSKSKHKSRHKHGKGRRKRGKMRSQLTSLPEDDTLGPPSMPHPDDAFGGAAGPRASEMTALPHRAPTAGGARGASERTVALQPFGRASEWTLAPTRPDASFLDRSPVSRLGLAPFREEDDDEGAAKRRPTMALAGPGKGGRRRRRSSVAAVKGLKDMQRRAQAKQSVRASRRGSVASHVSGVDVDTAFQSLADLHLQRKSTMVASAPAGAALPASDSDAWRPILLDFYSRVDPAKKSNVPKILQKFEHDRDKMIRTIEKKYPGERLERPGAAGRPPVDARDALTRFYKQFDEKKLANIDTLITRYGDNHEALFAKIEKKYGHRIERPSSAAAGKARARRSSRRRASVANMRRRKEQQKATPAAPRRSSRRHSVAGEVLAFDGGGERRRASVASVTSGSVPAMGLPPAGADDDGDHRATLVDELTEFFQANDPQKVGRVNTLMDKLNGDRGKIYELLGKLYPNAKLPTSQAKKRRSRRRSSVAAIAAESAATAAAVRARRSSRRHSVAGEVLARDQVRDLL